MDARLVGWARAVKRRRRSGLPVIWLFTDEERLADPVPAILRLPRGLCGVVLRHDGAVDRLALGRRVAAACRLRRLGLAVAGDARLAAALGAGVHLRGGRRPGVVRLGHRLVTSSAHDVPEMRRGRREGAAILFVSPAFATASHPGNRPLGPLRWRLLARHSGDAFAYALGGVDGLKVKLLAGFCCGIGAIHALEVGSSL